MYDGTYFQAIHSYDDNTTYGVASTTKDGLMSFEDKLALEGISLATDEEIDALF